MWWSKLIIDMKHLNISKEPLDEELQELGGRALIAQYMMKNIYPQCDPLSNENQLIFCTTLFAGTKLTTAHRLSVGGKSPLTGGIKESNVGGYAASLLAQHGIKLIVIKEQPINAGLWFLHLDTKGNFSLEDASEFKGLNNYAFVKKANARFSNKHATISIGQAGERLYKSASIQVSEFGQGHPSRAAGRGGLGALMGSKCLKAIIIEKPEEPFKVSYADENKFKYLCQEFNKIVAKDAKNNPFHNIGTISTIDVTGMTGILPVDNFSGKLFKDYKKVGSNEFMNNLKNRGGRNKISCQPGCVVQCSNLFNDKNGNYLTSGFEYETIALFGPNCHIGDLDAIAKMDRICDDFGVDTIEIANAIAVCMESGKIKWGDVDGVLSALNQMVDGTEFGNLLGNGCEYIGKSLGCKRIPVVKHQALAAYDPRNIKGVGVTYATSPMGADHTAGFTMGCDFGEHCGRSADVNASKNMQITMCFVDSMMCSFAFAHVKNNLELLVELISALYGGEADVSRVTNMGLKTLLTERTYNMMAGKNKKDDRIPEFFYEEPSVATGAKFDIKDYELDEIFYF